MTARLPSHAVRIALSVNRIADQIHAAARSLVSTAVCLMVTPDDHDAVTSYIYGKEAGFMRSGSLFDFGLFSWEADALATPPFPARGRILLGGAGGGREVAGLAKRGYHVVAFEPSALARGIEDIARETDGVEGVQAAYDDVVTAASGLGGPLAPFFREPFDGIVLGWGSLSHVVSSQARLHLLASLRTLAPDAPVLCSFWTDGESTLRRGWALRLHRARMFVQSLRAPGLSFHPRTGFFHEISRLELEDLARQGGYGVQDYAEQPFPHALLVPGPEAPLPAAPEQAS